MVIQRSSIVTFFIAIASIVILYTGCRISASNTANHLENQILSSWDRGKNELSTHTATISELAQLPAMQRDDLKDILEAAFIQSSNAINNQMILIWLQQNIPNLDKSVYSKIIAAIESGRLNYKQAQNELIAIKQVYRTELGSPIMGHFYKVTGYPTLRIGWPRGTTSMDDFPVIVTADADSSYKMGVDTPIKLR